MAGPILAFIGGTVSAAASTATNPIMLGVQYESARAMPIVIPDLPSMQQMLGFNYCSETNFTDLALNHGVQYTSPKNPINYTRQNDRDVATIIPNPNNVGESWHDRSMQLLRQYPTVDEANLMFNRGLIDAQLHSHILDKSNPQNPALTYAFAQLRHEIPGPSDLVRFAVRDCFTPEVVEQFEYSKETPIAIKPWMEKQGFGESIGLALPPNATDAAGGTLSGDASWFDLFWWSHWELPSPTQGYEMLHRLYIRSDFGPSPYVTATNEFAERDLALLLKASDYPDYWRERLIAISYHNLNRSDVVPMYERGLVTESEVYHALRADGYRDEEAKVLLRLANWKKQRFIDGNVDNRTKAWICKLYSAGVLTEDAAKSRLESLGYDYPGIDNFLSNCDLEASIENTKVFLGTLKRGFITGVLTEDNVRDSMNTQNLRPNFIERQVNQWTLLRGARYKQLSAVKNIKAYNLGLINRNELIARLQNLQYNTVAISTMVNLADYDIAQRQLKRAQKELELQQKAIKTNLAEQLKAQKEAKKLLKEKESNIEKQNQKRVRKLIVAMTDKNILAFWKKKDIELWEVFYRLYYRDFPIIDARKYVDTYLDGPTDEEKVNAEIKAQKVYRSEPNPPLV